MKGTTAEEAAECLLQHFGRYGLPFSVRSDNGPQFVNETIKSFLDRLGVDHDLTTPYSHEENGIVERSNEEILRHLSAILYDRSMATSEWVKFIPFVQRIINASKHSATGVSPAELLFGDNATLDKGGIPPNIPADRWSRERARVSTMGSGDVQSTATSYRDCPEGPTRDFGRPRSDLSTGARAETAKGIRHQLAGVSEEYEQEGQVTYSVARSVSSGKTRRSSVPTPELGDIEGEACPCVAVKNFRRQRGSSCGGGEGQETICCPISGPSHSSS